MAALETTTDNTGVAHSDGAPGLELPSRTSADAIAQSSGDDRMNPKSSASANAVLPALAIDIAASTSDKTGAAITTAHTDNDWATASVTDLTNRMEAAKGLTELGRDAVKAVYEEEFRRTEDPAKLKNFSDLLTANATALETGTDVDGKAIDAKSRMAMHLQDVQLISALTTGAELHMEYAQYLAGHSLARPADPADKGRAQIDSLDSPQGADAQLRLAIKDADQVDSVLMRRADAQINHDRAAGIGDLAALNDLKTELEGGRDDQGNVPGLANARVLYRDYLAAQYLKQGVDPGMVPPAIQVLTEARVANETIRGPGAVDYLTEQLLAFG
jgi:hypothetical protein